MAKKLFLLLLLSGLLHYAGAQQLHTRWDELTASDWAQALKLSDSTCILPIGVLGKTWPACPDRHRPHPRTGVRRKGG